jgi:hypothetical protein
LKDNQRKSSEPALFETMSTEPGQVRARSSSPGAERMRLYRKRRREGMRYVRIPLHVTEIDDLVRLGFLRGEQCQDPEALRVAVMGLIYGVLARAA